jgi:hypothetical protein
VTGWRKIKTLTPVETHRARAAMGWIPCTECGCRTYHQCETGDPGCMHCDQCGAEPLNKPDA